MSCLKFLIFNLTVLFSITNTFTKLHFVGWLYNTNYTQIQYLHLCTHFHIHTNMYTHVHTLCSTKINAIVEFFLKTKSFLQTFITLSVPLENSWNFVDSWNMLWVTLGKMFGVLFQSNIFHKLKQYSIEFYSETGQWLQKSLSLKYSSKIHEHLREP